MDETLSHDSAIPLYVQLEEILRAKIANGEWLPGQRIPSENELNKIYGVSRMTGRGVLTTLVNEGLLFRVQGKGTFVSPTKISAVSPAYRGLREQLEAMGYETTTELLGVEVETASAKVCDKLRLERGETVYAIHRLRSVQGEPISVHHSFVPARLAPGLDAHDTVNEQLCAILEKHYRLPMKDVEEHLSATAVSSEEAQLLGIRRGQPVLVLEDIISDSAGTLFEYSTIVLRGDKISLRADYRR